MSDQEKIWFIYLTDHHEGPFTPAEVAEKISQGAVTAQSLGRKDGMAEWVPIESIPELGAAIGGGAPAPASQEGGISLGASPPGGDDGFSLAQLLAQQQGGAGMPPSEDPSAAGHSSVLSSVAGVVQPAQSPGTGSVSMSIDIGGSGPVNAPSASLGVESEAPASEVGADDAIWTLRNKDQVSGLYSLNDLLGMAGSGDIPADAFLWRQGWTDFQPLSAVPEVAAARKPKKAGAAPAAAKSGVTKTGLTRPGFVAAPAGAQVGGDDPTDPGIEAPKAGFMGKVKGLFGRKKAAAAPAARPKPAMGTAALKGKSRPSALGGILKRVATLLVILGALGGAGAGYFLFLASPIPSDLDVIADDLEAMKVLVKESADQGQKLYLALARGTEDNPADDTAPKFYVATNMPSGTVVTLTVTGQPGTLVNRVSFESSFTANVGDNQIAVFEKVDDNGKPLPLGEYVLKVTAEGAEPLVAERFLGGRKGGAYADRLKKYKDKLQTEYDAEMQELRETIDTLKSLQADTSRRLADYKTGWATPSNRPRIGADWKAFVQGADAMTSQIEQKIKARTSAAQGQTFHPKAFEDVASTLAQLRQLMQMHGQRLEGAAPEGNLDELEGLVQAGVQSLESLLSQAMVKSPIDVLTAKPAGGAVPAPAAAPASAPAPAAQ